MKRLKDNSDVLAARRGILPKNIYKLKRKRQGYIAFSRIRNGYSQLCQQKSSRKVSLWLIPVRVC